MAVDYTDCRGRGKSGARCNGADFDLFGIDAALMYNGVKQNA